jgi:hypothetical protein
MFQQDLTQKATEKGKTAASRSQTRKDAQPIAPQYHEHSLACPSPLSVPSSSSSHIRRLEQESQPEIQKLYYFT